MSGKGSTFSGVVARIRDADRWHKQRRSLGKRCPKLKRPDGSWNPRHGLWYFKVSTVAQSPTGTRRRQLMRPADYCKSSKITPAEQRYLGIRCWAGRPSWREGKRRQQFVGQELDKCRSQDKGPITALLGGTGGDDRVDAIRSQTGEFAATVELADGVDTPVAFGLSVATRKPGDARRLG
jgi:hypothetical protein